MTSLPLVALDIARGEWIAGVRGGAPPFAKYRGTRVDEYQRAVGLPVPPNPTVPGFFWCAAAVYWTLARASEALSIPNPCPKTAGALRLWQFAPHACQTASAHAGCVFVLDRGGGRGHVGFVQSVANGGVLTTIEPDTANHELSATGDAWGRHDWDPAEGKRGALVGYLDFGAAPALVA